jgi:Asp-tRNA(Asn)/Glu-tRNA(Gln) amidotransferase C subunit
MVGELGVILESVATVQQAPTEAVEPDVAPDATGQCDAT